MRQRLGFLLCYLGLRLLLLPRHRHILSAYGADKRLYAILAPAWCAADLDTAAEVRLRVQRGLPGDPPPGWRVRLIGAK